MKQKWGIMNIFKEIKGEGENIIILHGWGCDHRHMQPIVDQLATRYRVTNFDLPGRGQSDWHPSIQTMHDIADQLLPHLPKQAIYIGWSFGGLVAMSIAARYPERVSRFVGIATTPKFIASDNWPGIPKPGFKVVFTEIEQKGIKEFFRESYDHEFIDFNPKPVAYHKLIEILDDTTKMDILYRGIEIVDDADLRKEFQSLSCPIDLILSEKDESMPLALTAKMQELNSLVKVHTIPSANHMAFWTHQYEFNKILNHIL